MCVGQWLRVNIHVINHVVEIWIGAKSVDWANLFEFFPALIGNMIWCNLYAWKSLTFIVRCRTYWKVSCRNKKKAPILDFAGSVILCANDTQSICDWDQNHLSTFVYPLDKSFASWVYFPIVFEETFRNEGYLLTHIGKNYQPQRVIIIKLGDVGRKMLLNYSEPPFRITWCNQFG